MAIAINSVTLANTENTGTFYTTTHATAGNDRGFLVLVSNTTQSRPHNITYNSASMTMEVEAQELSTGKRISIWSMISPAIGSNSVAISWSAAVAAAMTFISLTGVNQTDMVSGAAFSGGSSTSPTVQLSSTAGEVVFDVICYDTVGNAAAGSQQTDLANHSNPSIHGAVSDENGSAVVTMAWTLSASEEWVTGAVSVVPAAVSAPAATSSTISIDALTIAQTVNTALAFTIAHTVAGSNRGLLVLFSCTSQADPYNVSYAGVNMTREGGTQESPTGKRTAIWSLLAPTLGTNNVIVSLSAAAAIAVTIASLTNVEQIDMVGGYAGAAGSTLSPSVALVAAAGDLVFDSLTFDTVAASPTEQDQALRANQGNASVMNGVSSRPGTGNVSMTWALTGTEDWALGAVNVRPFIGLVGLAAYAIIGVPLHDLCRRDFDYYSIVAQPMRANGLSASVSASATATATATATSSAVFVGVTGATDPRISLVPGFLTDDAQWKRQTAAWMLEANQGRINNTGTITLAANAASTTVTDDRVGTDSFIGMMPRTANAAAEAASGTLYVITGKQTFTIAHTNNAQTDRTFVYSILG